MTDAAARYRAYLQSLSEESLAELGEHVSQQVRFKDPFNDVRGIEAMRAVLQHMFDNVGPVRFDIHRCLGEGEHCLMQWSFHGCLRGADWQFDGASSVRFDESGLVVEHVDYWDAGEASYEKLPGLGAVIRWLRLRIAHSPTS